ncbi:MAG: hypothetical protein ACJ8FY_03920 [Gemmataceae bacterium]
MAKFIPVWQELGADHWPESQAKIMVPLTKPRGESRLVLLEDAKGVKWTKANSNIEVAVVAKDETLHALNSYLANLSLAEVDRKSLLGALQARVTSSLSNGGQLLEVTGKAVGQSSIKAGTTLLNFVITKPIDYDITFKFLRCLDDDGAMFDATSHKPSEVDGWINQLHWILGSQANIWFVSTERRTFDIPKQLGFPLKKATINSVKEFAEGMDSSADVTVYLVGRYIGDSSSGTTFPDLSSKGDICIVLDDKCKEIPVVKGDDPFILTLAHELVHFVLDRRGQKGKEHHLFDLDKVLLSKKIESTVLSASTLDMLYPPDKK